MINGYTLLASEKIESYYKIEPISPYIVAGGFCVIYLILYYVDILRYGCRRRESSILFIKY